MREYEMETVFDVPLEVRVAPPAIVRRRLALEPPRAACLHRDSANFVVRDISSTPPRGDPRPPLDPA